MPAESGSWAGEVVRVGRRHAHQGVVVHAVEAAFKLQNLVATSVSARSPQSIECSFRAAAGEAHLVGTCDRADQLFRKKYSLFVVGEEGRTLLNLLADDLSDLRVRVANEHGA